MSTSSQLKYMEAEGYNKQHVNIAETMVMIIIAYAIGWFIHVRI